LPKVLPEYLAQRRQQILDAAEACFHRSGFHQTSMNDICEAAGLSPGAVYRYFKGKEEIIAAICDEAHQRDLALIESIKAHGSAEEVMNELGRAFLGELDEDEVRLMIDLLAEGPRNPHIRQVLQAGMRMIHDSFADFVRRGQRRGEISATLDPVMVARVMCALYHGYLVQKQIDPNLTGAGYFATVTALISPGMFTGRHSPELAPALTH
jgi:AcrR family transcriptional regulator